VIEVKLMLKAISAGPGARLFTSASGGGRPDTPAPALAATPASPQFDE